MATSLTSLGFLETSKTPLEAQMEAEEALSRLKIARRRRKERLQVQRGGKAIKKRKQSKRVSRPMKRIRRNRRRNGTRNGLKRAGVMKLQDRLSRLQIVD